MADSPGNIMPPPYGSDLFFEIQRGNVEGHTHIDKFGAANDVGTSWTIISSSKTYPTPTSATALEILSDDNTNDIAAGTGARKVTVQGLDENYLPITEEVSLNGTTAVDLTNTWTRVYRMWVSESGTYASTSGASHNSTITLRADGGGATWGQISTESNFGFGQSLIGAYTVPDGYTAWVYSYDINFESTKVPTVAFFKRENADDVTTPFSGTMRLQALHRGLERSLSIQHTMPLGSFVGPCDIGFFAKVGSGTTDISVQFEILQVDNKFVP